MAGGPPAPSPTGASSSHRKRKAPAYASPAASAAEEDESGSESEEVPMEELESEVADLGRRILEHRRAAATRLLDAASSRLAALRPPAYVEIPTELQPLPEASAAEADQEISEKLEILKSKTKANIAALPRVLERVNESTTGVEKLEKLNLNIHPVFRRKRKPHPFLSQHRTRNILMFLFLFTSNSSVATHLCSKEVQILCLSIRQCNRQMDEVIVLISI